MAGTWGVFYPSASVFEQVIFRIAKVLERNLRGMEQNAFQLNASRSSGGGGGTESDKATARVEAALGGKKQVSVTAMCGSCVARDASTPHLCSIAAREKQDQQFGCALLFPFLANYAQFPRDIAAVDHWSAQGNVLLCLELEAALRECAIIICTRDYACAPAAQCAHSRHIRSFFVFAGHSHTKECP